MNALIGKSFDTQVFIFTPGHYGFIGVTDDAPFDNGWLIRTGTSRGSVSLRFNYRAHTEDRILFDIEGGQAAGAYTGAKLGLSSNGYLGFYRKAAVTEPWKMEVLSYSPKTGQLFFQWRDSDGYRVSLRQPFTTPASILTGQNTHRLHLVAGPGDGEVVQFCATVKDFL